MKTLTLRSRPALAALTLAVGTVLAAPAQAQFAERTIRVSNGVNQDRQELLSLRA